jgi:5-methylcytosine-specific restriction protein A
MRLKRLQRSFARAFLTQVFLNKWQKLIPSMRGAEEGGVSYSHRIYERDRSLRQRKKEQVMKSQGKLACEACDFDFAATYGELGEGYIEVHHIGPFHR